jgi:hypothetical protein
MKKCFVTRFVVLAVIVAGTRGMANVSCNITFSQGDLEFSQETRDTVVYDIVELKGIVGTTQECSNPSQQDGGQACCCVGHWHS